MDYCTQNDGECSICNLVKFGRDCHGNAIAIFKKSYCQCSMSVVFCRKHKANYEGTLIAKRHSKSTVAL